MKTPAELPILMSQRSTLTKDLAISFLMQQGVENPDCLSLAAGLVDPETLPVEETLRAAQQVLATRESGIRALQYGTTPGSAELRSELLTYFADLEKCSIESLGIDASQMILTTGSQQLLSLVCETLLDPGDICLVAGPTYFVFAGNLAGVGARTVTIPSDDQGMDPAALDHALEQIASMKELHRVKLIYAVSYYDNPSGVCLSTSRREQIVEIAKKWSREHRILVLEDAAYRELRYDGEEHPSVWSFDQERANVIYTQTFSKTFSPGIRVGFGIVPKELVTAICERKGNEDFGSAHFNQKLIATVLRSGEYQGHLAKVRDGYRLKRDAMLAAAQKYFSDLPGVSWVHPKGGLYVWMTLPESLETGFDRPLFSNAVKHGVMYVPGELCYAGPVEDRPRSQMRLSYGVLPVDLIDEAMRRLADAVRETQSARTSNDVSS